MLIVILPSSIWLSCFRKSIIARQSSQIFIPSLTLKQNETNPLIQLYLYRSHTPRFWFTRIKSFVQDSFVRPLLQHLTIVALKLSSQTRNVISVQFFKNFISNNNRDLRSISVNIHDTLIYSSKTNTAKGKFFCLTYLTLTNTQPFLVHGFSIVSLFMIYKISMAKAKSREFRLCYNNCTDLYAWYYSCSTIR